MCGAQTRWPGAASAAASTCLGLRERGRDRLLDEHVLAGLERRAREPAVLGHARQHEHDVDVRMPADRDVVGQVGGEVEPLGGRRRFSGSAS